MASVRKSLVSNLFFALIFYLLQLQCLLSFPIDKTTMAELINIDNASIVRNVHVPKFGERLLPLRKKNATVVNAKKGNGGSGVVHMLLNKNIYSITQSEEGTKKNEKSSAFINKNIQIGRYIKNNANLQKNQRVQHANSKFSPLAELFTLAVSTLDEHVTIRSPSKPPTQSNKLLNRREDINIHDLPYNLNHLLNISKADRLEMSTEFFVVPTIDSIKPLNNINVYTSSKSSVQIYIKPTVSLSSTTRDPLSILIASAKSNRSTGNSPVSTFVRGTPSTISSSYSSLTGLRKEPWVVPVLVLASLTMLIMSAFEIFVLLKAWRTSPSRRHLFLGQMLLLGLFTCAGLGAVITTQPSILSCGIIRFGVGVAYALVFAALLVKCVFLISLNGGIYLPAPYQGLLLLFAVLIQVAVGSQWLLTEPPEMYTLTVPIINGSNNGISAAVAASEKTLGYSETSVSTADITAASTTIATLIFSATDPSTYLYTRVSTAGMLLIPLCKTQFSEILSSLIYIVFLIIFVAVLAIKSRGIRDNYREATYIGLAIGGAILIWLAWTLCGLVVAERHKDACIAFGLIATSATVFFVMFMSKGRQLAAMGKEGFYVKDRKDQFGSISHAESGYSQSFFHFKPIKYGVMCGGGIQNSTLNTGNGATIKHSSNAMNVGGNRK